MKDKKFVLDHIQKICDWIEFCGLNKQIETETVKNRWKIHLNKMIREAQIIGCEQEAQKILEKIWNKFN